MPLVNREGRFKARIEDCSVSETGDCNLFTFTARFILVEEYHEAESEWYDISANGEGVVGYFYLEKKGQFEPGSNSKRRPNELNTFAIAALKDALGWDGCDIFALQNADYSSTVVQLVIVIDTYNNRSRPKVKYINAENSEPASGVQRANDATLQMISNRIGSKLRANAGGTPRPAPTPTTPRPAAPPVAPPKAATTPPPRAATMDEAWGLFVAAWPANLPDDDRERQWFRILAELFPGKAVESLAAADWQRFADEGLARIVPF
jgi:hypothetical protein